MSNFKSLEVYLSALAVTLILAAGIIPTARAEEAAIDSSHESSASLAASAHPIANESDQNQSQPNQTMPSAQQKSVRWTISHVPSSNRAICDTELFENEVLGSDRVLFDKSGNQFVRNQFGATVKPTKINGDIPSQIAGGLSIESEDNLQILFDEIGKQPFWKKLKERTDALGCVLRRKGIYLMPNGDFQTELYFTAKSDKRDEFGFPILDPNSKCQPAFDFTVSGNIQLTQSVPLQPQDKEASGFGNRLTRPLKQNEARIQLYLVRGSRETNAPGCYEDPSVGDIACVTYIDREEGSK